MSEKEIAKKVIDTLPDDATLDDVIHALYIKIKFEQGEKEIRGGKGMSQKEAEKKMEKWLN